MPSFPGSGGFGQPGNVLQRECHGTVELAVRFLVRGGYALSPGPLKGIRGNCYIFHYNSLNYRQDGSSLTVRWQPAGHSVSTIERAGDHSASRARRVASRSGPGGGAGIADQIGSVRQSQAPGGRGWRHPPAMYTGVTLAGSETVQRREEATHARRTGNGVHVFGLDYGRDQ
jgi:hypothetical protein